MPAINTDTTSSKLANGAAHAMEGFENKARLTDSQMENLQQLTHKIGEGVGQVASQITDTASRKFEQSKSYLKANPVKSLAIAVTAGAVVGSLVTWMARRKD